MAQHFTVTSAQMAAERKQILPMTQHVDTICNEETFLPLFTNHRRC
jgi:hypothetical protein